MAEVDDNPVEIEELPDEEPVQETEEGDADDGEEEEVEDNPVDGSTEEMKGATPEGAEGAGDGTEDGAVTQPEGRGGRANRNEKKSRKALQRLGLKPVPNIVRVTIQKSKTIVLAISNPDVYQAPTADTYIIFGEAKLDDLGAQAQSQAASEFAQQPPAAAATNGAKITEEDDDEDEDEVVDETGVSEEDINLILEQCSVSRAKAVKALKEKGDVVDAIMHLGG